MLPNRVQSGSRSIDRFGDGTIRTSTIPLPVRVRVSGRLALVLIVGALGCTNAAPCRQGDVLLNVHFAGDTDGVWVEYKWDDGIWSTPQVTPRPTGANTATVEIGLPDAGQIGAMNLHYAPAKSGQRVGNWLTKTIDLAGKCAPTRLTVDVTGNDVAAVMDGGDKTGSVLDASLEAPIVLKTCVLPGPCDAGDHGGQGGSAPSDAADTARGYGGAGGGAGGVLIDSVTFNDLTLSGYVAPRSPVEIQSSRWGLNLHVPSPLGAFVDEVAGTGVKWVRIWMDPGIFDAGGNALFDDLLTRLAALKITPFITFPNQTPALNTWEGKVTKVVNRYKDLVRYWEIFNEPNYGISAATYANYVKGGAATIKAIQPEAKIVAGVLAHVDTTYLKAMLSAGAGPSMDILAFHPYNTLPEYELSEATTYPQLKSMLATATPPIIPWQGECGYPSTATSEGWHRNGPWSERVQAKWLTRRLLTDLGENLPVSVYYELRDTFYGARPSTFGLLRQNTWAPKPAYYTLATITSIFDSRFDTPKTANATFSITSPGSYTGQGASSIKVVSAGGAQGDVVTYWLPGVLLDASNAAQTRLTLSNANLTDPVLVDLLDGRVISVPVTTDASGALLFANLPLADYAFAIVSRAAVTVQPSAPKP